MFEVTPKQQLKRWLIMGSTNTYVVRRNHLSVYSTGLSAQSPAPPSTLTARRSPRRWTSIALCSF